MEFKWLVILFSFLYLGLLFAIAYWAEQNRHSRWVNNTYIYALSLAVYCTAWTYYGSVGRAANEGLDFLTTYIGPILMAPLMWVILRKIIRICKVQRITTIADFISTRYGKEPFLGGLVTIVCVIGVLPYISIQIKAISVSFSTLMGTVIYHNDEFSFFNDTAFYITLFLVVFTILFGARKVDANQKNTGLIAAIAFESVFKLIAFLVTGAYVTFYIFNGFSDVFTQASALPGYAELVTINKENGYSNWMWLNLLSMIAILLLPRQFHVSVKENCKEGHLKKAMWLFPLYLLLINIFVIPVALGGNLLFQDKMIDPDTYLLAIPVSNHNALLAMLTYLGGLSAATSMIIVSATALAVMLSNSVFMPVILRSKRLSATSTDNLSMILVRSRQTMIVLVLLFSYLYFKYISGQFSLVSIGLISFAAVAQFAPAALLGIYWKGATRRGAVAGIIAGFVIWFYTLTVPAMVSSNILGQSILTEGPFGISLLKPQQFLGLTSLSYINNGFFWSLFFNLVTFFVASFFSVRSTRETNQAEVFVDIFKYSTVYESSIVWKGTAYVEDIKSLISAFLGKERTEKAFGRFIADNNLDTQSAEADFRVVNYAEKLLSGAVGSASAHALIATVVKEDHIDLSDVFNILQESRQVISDNKELKQKSKELKIASKKLRKANEELKRLDKLKDEFISTVTHEMRTPVTSIRAFSEILSDNPALGLEERLNFLETITSETKRMERLINQVLDIEKMESGKLKMDLLPVQLNDIVNDAVNTVRQIARDKGIKISLNLLPGLPLVKGNKDRLMQVVINLISNAIKFCAIEQGVIEISTNSGHDAVKLTVQDNGHGIPAESQELIFEAFYQGRDQNLKKSEGSGLGLTICKKIIERHRGKIWVESSKNKGSIFTFSIPLGNLQ
ncbi:MAG: sensor histidine kinase [Cytophagales bacterium]|nr:sensor histidine kinase [Cytophagales bacterium]